MLVVSILSILNRDVIEKVVLTSLLDEIHPLFSTLYCRLCRHYLVVVACLQFKSKIYGNNSPSLYI